MQHFILKWAMSDNLYTLGPPKMKKILKIKIKLVVGKFIFGFHHKKCACVLIGAYMRVWCWKQGQN